MSLTSSLFSKRVTKHPQSVSLIIIIIIVLFFIVFSFVKWISGYKTGVFAEDSSIVVCGSDHGKIYIFSTASPMLVQILTQAGGSTSIQALNVSFN